MIDQRCWLKTIYIYKGAFYKFHREVAPKIIERILFNQTMNAEMYSQVTKIVNKNKTETYE